MTVRVEPRLKDFRPRGQLRDKLYSAEHGLRITQGVSAPYSEERTRKRAAVTGGHTAIRQ